MKKLYPYLAAIISIVAITSIYRANAEEPFYGKWIITRVMAWSRVSGYTEEEENDFIGKEVLYSANISQYDENFCHYPNYKKGTMDQSEFDTYFHTRFEQLNITSETIAIVEVYTDPDYHELWGSTGSIFIIKDRKTLILFSRGVFFEMKRK